MKLPAIFFGHGSPMNAVWENGYTHAWRRLGQGMPKPKAILAISAHWYVHQTGVTISTSPRTIHDFGGFPSELYEVQYPAPGDPALANRVQQLLAPQPVAMDSFWGLDHGTWSVLKHVYPQADIPVVQISINRSQLPAFHFEIGQRLAPLREEGILIMGSGNLVHNLRAYTWDQQPAQPFDWAVKFEEEAKQMLLAEEYRPLIEYQKLGPEAKLSIPTPEHYLPLLYVMGTRLPGEEISFPVAGIDGGSISMLAVQAGGAVSLPHGIP